MPQVSLETYLLLLMTLSILGATGLALWIWRSGAKWPRSSGIAPTAAEPPHQIDLNDTSVKLVDEAAAILKLVRSQITIGERFSKSLAEADKSLPKLSNPEQVRAVIKFLIAENAKMQQETHELRSNLELSQRQIEQLRGSLAEVEEISVTDSLTGKANRRGFDTSIQRAVTEASLLKTPLSVVMCDLDHFKKVNDKYGHPVGDEVLRVFASVLADNIRAGDTVARYGGEEFAVILTRTDAGSAARVCERMRSDIAARRLALNRNGELIANVTASFGIAQYAQGDTPGSLVERADKKLYEAKRDGRNRVVTETSSIAA